VVEDLVSPLQWEIAAAQGGAFIVECGFI